MNDFELRICPATPMKTRISAVIRNGNGTNFPLNNA